MSALVGVGAPQAASTCARPNYCGFLCHGEVFHSEWKFSSSGAAFPDSCQASRSSSPNSDWFFKRQQGFTPTLTVPVFLSVPFFPVSGVVRAWLGTHRRRAPKRKGSVSGQSASFGELSDVTRSSLTQKSVLHGRQAVTCTSVHTHDHSTRPQVHNGTHTYVHIHIRTHTYTYIHIHTHTYTHTALNKSSAAQRNVARDCACSPHAHVCRRRHALSNLTVHLSEEESVALRPSALSSLVVPPLRGRQVLLKEGVPYSSGVGACVLLRRTIVRGRPGHTFSRAFELAGGRGYASRKPW